MVKDGKRQCRLVFRRRDRTILVAVHVPEITCAQWCGLFPDDKAIAIRIESLKALFKASLVG